MGVNILKELEKKIGYTFNNIKLLELAMSHTSYANETKGKESNERIEYLGDAVLELYLVNIFTKLILNYQKEKWLKLELMQFVKIR